MLIFDLLKCGTCIHCRQQGISHLHSFGYIGNAKSHVFVVDCRSRNAWGFWTWVRWLWHWSWCWADGHWNEDDNDDDDGNVSVPETAVEHESRLQSVLTATLDPSEDVTDFGMSIYLRAREIAFNIQWWWWRPRTVVLVMQSFTLSAKSLLRIGHVFLL